LPTNTSTATIVARPTFARTSAASLTPSATLADGTGGGGEAETTTPTPSPTPTRTPTLPAQLINAVRIGLAGGEVECNSARLIFEPGAVPNGSGLRCNTAPADNLPAALSEVFVVEVFDARGQALTAFSPPIKFCLAYTDAQVRAANGNANNLTLMQSDANGDWQELPNVVVETTTRELCAPIPQLASGKLGVFAKTAPPPPPPNGNIGLLLIGGGLLFLLAVALIIAGFFWSRKGAKPEEEQTYGF
jgi:hypothetical protein